jgi:hypothetical protein
MIHTTQEAFLNDMNLRFKQFTSTIAHTMDENVKTQYNQSELRISQLESFMKSTTTSNECFDQSIAIQRDQVKKNHQNYISTSNEVLACRIDSLINF